MRQKLEDWKGAKRGQAGRGEKTNHQKTGEVTWRAEERQVGDWRRGRGGERHCIVKVSQVGEPYGEWRHSLASSSKSSSHPIRVTEQDCVAVVTNDPLQIKHNK